jgi:beta-galactosidase
MNILTLDGYPFPRIGCGVIKNVYSTIDFGIDKNVNATFELMRQYSPKGPLVNSEFYPGF